MRVLTALLLVFFCTSGLAQSAPSDSPRGDDPPLPPLRELLLDLDRNEKSVEVKARDYTYHVHEDQQEFDGNGTVKKTSSADSESLTINGVRVNRVVARGGKPLTPDDVRKEDERIDKELVKARERREKNEGKGEDVNSRGDVLIPASRVLVLGTFTNLRRELLAGRPTIVMDYAGSPEAKTHGPAEGVIRDLVGTVWVDEADRVLVRGQGHFLNDFKIAGGLVVSIHKGFSFEFQAAKVNDDAWLPASFAGQGSARVLLFNSINGSLHATISNYRKFRTDVTIQPASHVLDENGNPLPEQTAPPQPAQPPSKQPNR